MLGATGLPGPQGLEVCVCGCGCVCGGVEVRVCGGVGVRCGSVYVCVEVWYVEAWVCGCAYGYVEVWMCVWVCGGVDVCMGMWRCVCVCVEVCVHGYVTLFILVHCSHPLNHYFRVMLVHLGHQALMACKE